MHVEMKFNLPDSFEICYSQGDNSVCMTGDDCSDYLQGMVGPLEAGMAFTISNWGDDYGKMQWLDGDTGCSGNCGGGNSHYSHVAIETGSGDYVQGGPPCDYDQCGSECAPSHCLLHYPVNDPAKWESQDAECRCAEEGSNRPIF